ncbi:MAG: type II secretion system secretin GspD, partial [Candidatus Thioglobus sp.]|nr:type II secretion system secretin GspD [Candidatus Thioglobus sp.]
RPLMSQYGHLAVYAASNSLIVVDSQINIERLKNLLKKLDKSVDSDFETITLRHTGAGEMSQIIKTLIIDKNLGSPLSMVVDKHSNQIIMSGAEEKRLTVRLLVAELDQKQDQVSGTQVVYLNYANAKEILPILQNIAKRSDAENNKGKADASKQSSIAADESTNSIIITGSTDTVRNVKHIITKLDIRKAQVLIEAIIAEISLDDTKNLGVQWVASTSKVAGGFNTGLLGNLLGAAAARDDSGNIPLSSLPQVPEGGTFGIGAFDEKTKQGFGVILTALQKSGKANILSTPSIITLDNEEAEIIVGEEVPFVTKSEIRNDNPFQEIERKDVGLTLKVKPQINNGNSIKLDIEQETSVVKNTSSSSKTINPADLITSKRSIKTSVILEDKQLLVLGGLVDETWSNNETKIPFLGDLPIIGALFSQENKIKNKRNLVVFIRVTILSNSEIASKISNQKYKYIKALNILKGQDEFFADDISQKINSNISQKINSNISQKLNTNMQLELK